MFAPVDPADLDALWFEISPWIAAACSRTGGNYDAHHVRADILSGAWQLWLYRDDRTGQATCIAVTEIKQHPSGRKTLSIPVLTGRDHKDWLHHIADLETFARARGCQAMQLLARPGWSRVLRTKGYRPSHVLTEKAL